MEYELARQWVFSRPVKALTAEEAKLLREAMEGLRALTSFEDKFYVLIENFVDLEVTVAEAAAHHMVRPLINPDEFADRIREANRKVMNLLSAGRMYWDQTIQHLSLWAPHTTNIAALFEAAAENSLAVRVVRALRNHVQHRDLPVHRLSLGSKWADPETPHKHVCYCKLEMRLDQLEADPRFSKAILGELQALPQGQDLRRFLREFVSEMAGVHREIRDRLAPIQTEWHRAIADADSFATQTDRVDDHSISLALVERGEDGQEVSSLELYPGIVARLTYLQRRNFCPQSLGRSYFTSEILD